MAYELKQQIQGPFSRRSIHGRTRVRSQGREQRGARPVVLQRWRECTQGVERGRERNHGRGVAAVHAGDTQRYQRKQRDAVRETEEMLAKAKDEATRLAAEAAANLEIALARREEMAHQKIARAEAEALRQVREIAVDVAVAAARELIADKLDDGSRAALVDAAIAELPEKLH